jgi:exosortase
MSLPLQFIASHLGSSLLGLLGVPVLREGNIIQMSTLTLDVAEACSGLRSLISLFTFAVIYGYLKESTVVRRICLVLAAIPVAVAANGLRIVGIGLLGQYGGPDLAEGFLHTISGVAVFFLAILLLILIHAAMHCTDRLISRRTI